MKSECGLYNILGSENRRSDQLKEKIIIRCRIYHHGHKKYRNNSNSIRQYFLLLVQQMPVQCVSTLIIRIDTTIAENTLHEMIPTQRITSKNSNFFVVNTYHIIARLPALCSDINANMISSQLLPIFIICIRIWDNGVCSSANTKPL